MCCLRDLADIDPGSEEEIGEKRIRSHAAEKYTSVSNGTHVVIELRLRKSGNRCDGLSHFSQGMTVRTEAVQCGRMK